MRQLLVAGFVFMILFIAACSPVSKGDSRQERKPLNIDLSQTSRSSANSTSQSPSIELKASDRQSTRMLIGYCSQVTGLNNAYLSAMDQFFHSFRSYYETLHRYSEDNSTAVIFEKTGLVPNLTTKQTVLEEHFQAVDFLSADQNEYVITSIITLRKRLTDLGALSNTLSDYVERKDYKQDADLNKGEQLLMQINDHCAQFYQTHRELGNFIEDLQFEGRSTLLIEEVDGEASLNVLSDLRNIKSLILRLGDYRYETDDLHELSNEYKSVVTALNAHTNYEVEKISDAKTRQDYQAVYNSIFSHMLPRINKVIYELENKNVEWLQSDFNKTIEAVYKSYNDLSRFYAEGYGKAAPMGN